MKPVTCILADDEPHALQILERYASQIEWLKVVASCRDAIEVKSALSSIPVDILILDIEMPELSGLELIQTLENSPHIIFTTAYKEYAVDAFECNARDYLLKPFSFDRFLKALHRVTSGQSIDRKTEPSLIQIMVDREKVVLRVDEILYIQSLGNYMKVFTNDKIYVTHESIKNFLQMLPFEVFVQIHKSYIISIRHIKSYNSTQVVIGANTIPVGRLFKESFMKTLQKSQLIRVH